MTWGPQSKLWVIFAGVKDMNELENYHYHEGEREVVDLEAQPDSGGAGSPNLLSGVFRRWYILLLVFILLCGAGLPAVWYHIEPQYVVTGAIRFKPDVQNPVTGASEEEITNYESFMNTQAEKVTSSTVIQRVADILKDRNLSFFEEKPPRLLLKLEEKLGISLTGRTGEGALTN